MPEGVRTVDGDMGTSLNPQAHPGDVVFFMDGAQTHGTYPWTNDHERRSILYKYSPGTLSYSKRYVPPGVEDVLDEFTPEQRAVLEPPYRTNRPLLDVG